MAHIDPIRLATLSDLSAHGYQLSCYCPRCRRWAELDLPHLAERGFADRRLVEFTPRCRTCGTPGEKQVRPPRRWRGPASRATFAHHALQPEA